MTEADASPLVTVAVPTFNRAGYLRECLASVRAQTYPALEILVGDNASSDRTPALLDELAPAEPRLRTIRHDENLGMIGNWNRLLELANGDYFMLLSDDDLLHPRAIERLILAFSRAPNVTLAYSGFLLIDERGTPFDQNEALGPTIEPGRSFVRGQLDGRRVVCPAAMMFPIPPRPADRPYYESIGPLCDQLQRIVVALDGHVACVREPLARYRMHQANESLQIESYVGSFFRLRDSLVQAGPPASEFAGEVPAFAHRMVTALAISAAVRGHCALADRYAAALESYGLSTYRVQASLRVARTRPARVLASVRRAWRARRARRVAGQFPMAG
jgi:glycosyltransferase involved in cell wall biosynthesis